LHVPLRSAFSLPRPEDPSSGLFESVELGIDELANIALVRRAHSGDGAVGFARTAALSGAGRAIDIVGTVIAGADTLAVEPDGTVGDGTGELTSDGPLVVARHLATKAASLADMVLDAHG